MILHFGLDSAMAEGAKGQLDDGGMDNYPLY